MEIDRMVVNQMVIWQNNIW